MTSENLPGARALASRGNGARSRGPVTAAGKACSARNALKHGLRARTLVLLGDEDAAAFQEFAAALTRDGNGPWAIKTLPRDRGSVLAEPFCAPGALKALQAEGSAQEEPGAAATLLPPLPRESKRTREAEES